MPGRTSTNIVQVVRVEKVYELTTNAMFHHAKTGKKPIEWI
jgi:hypothetical protein